MFFREDIVADPLGKLGTAHPGDGDTFGFLCRSKFYGFKLDGVKWGRFEGHVMFVHVEELEVG